MIPVGYPDNDFSAAPVLRWIDPVTSMVTAELPISVDTSDFPMPSDITSLGDGTAALTVIGGSNEAFDRATNNLFSYSEWQHMIQLSEDNPTLKKQIDRMGCAKSNIRSLG